MNPLSALDWQEIFLSGCRAVPRDSELGVALAAMAAKAREIAERQLRQ